MSILFKEEQEAAAQARSFEEYCIPMLPLQREGECIMAITAQTTSKSPGLLERLNRGSGLTPYLLVFPAILVILVIAIYPILDSIYLSFIDNPLRSSAQFIGFQNYVQVLSNRTFQGTIGVTIIFSVISVALETIFGLGIAI